MRSKYLTGLLLLFLTISCKTIGPDLTKKVFKNEYITVVYMRFDKDSVYHYTSEFQFQGASPYIISGDQIWENGYNIQFRDTYIIQKDKLVSAPPYKFEFKPISKKEMEIFFKKVEETPPL